MSLNKWIAEGGLGKEAEGSSLLGPARDRGRWGAWSTTSWNGNTLKKKEGKMLYSHSKGDKQFSDLNENFKITLFQLKFIAIQTSDWI